MKMHKRLYVVITALGSLALFTSCGKADKADIESDLKSIGIEVGTDTESASMPDRLDYIVQSASGETSVTVSATVDTESMANAAVYDVEHKSIDEEYLKQLADGFFDGDYSFVKIYEHCSLEELEEEQSFYNQLADEYGDSIYSYAEYYRVKIDELLNAYNETGTSHAEYNGLIYHNEQYSVADAFFDDIMEEESYHITAADYSRLRGEADGHIYELYYEKYYTESKSSSAVIYDSYDPERIIIRCIDTPYYVKGRSDMGTSASNVCDYDAALNQAEDAIGRLGFQEWEIANTYQLDIAASVDMTYMGLNGYEFWFTPEQNGKYVFNFKGDHMVAFGSEHDKEWVYGTGQPLLRVVVTDNGVEEIDIGDVYSKSDGEGKKAGLISFEKIDEIAKKQMSTYNENLEITSVKLGYLYISYDGIKYALVPAWAYCYEDNGTEKVFAYINALDGELICKGYEKILPGYHPVIGEFSKLVTLYYLYD